MGDGDSAAKPPSDLPLKTRTSDVASIGNIASDFSNMHMCNEALPSQSTANETKHESHSPRTDKFLRLGLSPITPNGDSDGVDETVSASVEIERDGETTSHASFEEQTFAPSSHVSPTHMSMSSPVLHKEPGKTPTVGLPFQPSPSSPAVAHMDVTFVLDGLYLSDFASLSPARLRTLGVSLIINATHEVPNVPGADAHIEFMKLGVDDVATENISRFLDVCADRIHDVRTSGGVALIHCALGISRSVTICLAYLVKHEGRTLRQAYFELKKKRPIIRPNEGFWRQLIAFEVAKNGRATVKLNVYPMGVVPDVYRGAPRTATTRKYPRY